jgi:hypothetical protein
LTFLSAFQNRVEGIDDSCLNIVFVNGTTGNDSYDGSAPVFVSGSVGPKQTIQAGINVVCAGGTVNVAAGIYNLADFININQSLNLIGAGAGSTIINGSSDPHDEVIGIYGIHAGNVLISGFTIRNGMYNGIYVDFTAVNNVITINDCIITHNNSYDFGGGVWIDANNVITMNRCTVSNNTASNVPGGSLGYRSTPRNLGAGFGDPPGPTFGGGIAADNCTLNLNQCTISNNTAIGDGDPDSGTGGGIFAVDNTTLNMNGCTVNSNRADWWGGGIFYAPFSDQGLATINNCTIDSNLAGRAGGGLFILAWGFSAEYASNQSAINQGDVPGDNVTYDKKFQAKSQQFARSGFGTPIPGAISINNCAFTNNVAINWGGGMASIASLYSLNGCTFSGNAAGRLGGGIGTFLSLGELVNCTISGNKLTYPNIPEGFDSLSTSSNQAGNQVLSTGTTLPTVSNAGGGIGMLISLAAFECDTIANNATGSDNNSYGGGIFNSRGLYSVFVNTIVANNTAVQTSTNNCLNRGTIFSLGHNIDSQNSDNFTAPTDQVNTNPLLGPLQNNGGPTQTCAIGDNSPAFDRGDNNFMPPTDQRGTTRPRGAFCDIGAYEFVLTNTSTTTTTTGVGGNVTFTTGSGGISGLTALPVDACGTFTGGPDQFPYGIFAFNIIGIAPGATVPVTITLPLPIAGNLQYWKCGGAAGWVDVTSLVTYSPGDTRLILNLTDGGLGDADHLANGRIVDPGGPAFMSANRPHSSSPYIAPVQQPVPLPSLTVQSAALSASKVDSGMPVTVTATVTNKGTADGSMKLKLLVNSREAASQTVTVPKGSSVPVKFTVIKDEPGTYTVYVEGITAGSFTVNDWVNPDKILFISSGLLFCALLIGIYMVWRRRRYS